MFNLKTYTRSSCKVINIYEGISNEILTVYDKISYDKRCEWVIMHYSEKQWTAYGFYFEGLGIEILIDKPGTSVMCADHKFLYNSNLINILYRDIPE